MGAFQRKGIKIAKTFPYSKGDMANKEKSQVIIYTDGACSGNPGPGGYGAILKYGKETKEISGCEPNTTNNRMELMAAVSALKLIKRPCKIQIITDSNYMVKGMTQWIHGWIKKNWINAQKKPVLNRDLWEELLKLSQGHDIEWHWIRGHQGHPENERCDQIARQALKKCSRSHFL
jgi:ribonuclease HI